MKTLTIESAISNFGAKTKEKLANPAITGRREDQLRAPFEQLLADIAELVALSKAGIVAVDESPLPAAWDGVEGGRPMARAGGHNQGPKTGGTAGKEFDVRNYVRLCIWRLPVLLESRTLAMAVRADQDLSNF